MMISTVYIGKEESPAMNAMQEGKHEKSNGTNQTNKQTNRGREGWTTDRRIKCIPQSTIPQYIGVDVLAYQVRLWIMGEKDNEDDAGKKEGECEQ